MRNALIAAAILAIVGPVFAQSANVDQVINDLRQMCAGDAGAWRFHAPGLADATAPGLDDSKWLEVRPEHQWDGENTFAWYRKHIIVPEKIAGVSIAGAMLVLNVGCDDLGEIYVNGQLKQKFLWDKGQATITDSAKPGEELVIAVKCINQGGPGRLLNASLRYTLFDLIAADAAEEADRLAFARRLASSQPKPAEMLAVVQAAAAKVDFAALNARNFDAFRASLQASADALKPLDNIAKQDEAYLIGHAHIDMNWLWLWPETQDVCYRTWTQACNFMEEFPQFRFGQSQPGAYIAIQEKYPELFARMQKYVREGRWELTGGTWVEGDMNMASGESIVRSIMLARQYFLENFGKAPEIGWCPDTFGHAATIPTIMANSGLKYYYFCRTGKGPPLFWWEGPEGSRLLAYNRGGYGDSINPGIADAPLDVYRQTGVRKGMIVYGVGDHGGGPTRADINEALRLQKLEAFPKVKFATTSEFYGDALKARQLGKDFPVIKDELNTVFEGCYTTHADIKRWNRELENSLPVAETLSLIVSRSGFPYPQDDFTSSWRSTCFNQFHDIFDGSAIHGSYEYSGQLYKDAIGKSNKAEAGALETIARSLKAPKTPGTIPVMVYNPLAWERDDVVEVTVPASFSARELTVTSPDGKAVPAQVLDRAANQSRILFIAHKVPSLGYAVYTVSSQPTRPGSFAGGGLALGNGRYEMYFDEKTGAIKRWYDNALKRDLIAPGTQGNVLQALQEAPHGMSAWDIGPIKSTESLTTPISITRPSRYGPAMNSVRIEHKFRSSSFTQEVRMYAGLPRIDVILKADWQEIGKASTGSPMMKVAFPLAAKSPVATFEIPYGSIERATNGAEVPAQKWIDLTETAVSRLDGKQSAMAEPVDIAKYFNQDGISGLEKPLDGIFDLGAWALPAEMFASAKTGLLNVDGIPFIAPPLADGAKNMISCQGQRLDLPAGRAQNLQIMGSASNGSQSGNMQLLYTDGSAETVGFGFSDWCGNPGAGERAGLHSEYRVAKSGKAEPPCNVFIRDVPLQANKTLKAVVLPNQEHIHIVAITRSAAVARKALYGVSLLNNCKYGHDVKGNVMRMTLLRSSYDPDPTPDQGQHEITYSFVPHEGDWRAGGTVRRAYELNEPLRAVVVTSGYGNLPWQQSFAQLEPNNLILTALKRAEDGRGIIARFYESEGRDCTAVLRIPGVKRAIETNLVEVDKPGAALKASDGTVRFAVKAHQPRCVRLMME